MIAMIDVDDFKQINDNLKQALEEAEREWNENRKTEYSIYLSMELPLATMKMKVSSDR